MDSLVELFVAADDFWIIFRPCWHEHLLVSGERWRIRASRLPEKLAKRRYYPRTEE
jgi:hypothetical protein